MIYIMKFSCEKAVLLAAVSAASRTVSTRTSIPALEGILIEAANTSVTLTGYNLATGIRAVIGIEDGTPGACVINAKLLGDIVRKSADDWITISCDEKLTVTIKCGMSEFTLIGLAAADFPALPEQEDEMQMQLEQGVLRSMISMTVFAVSDNENKPVHTGALFECAEKKLTVVAVDGFRLAIRREEVVAASGDFNFVVPSQALREVERLCSEGGDIITVSLGRRHITFDMGDTILISRLLEGEFLNYRNAVPKDAKYSVVCDTHSLRSAVDRVSLIISERLKNPVRCLFGNNNLRVFCQTALGKANDEMFVEGEGGETEIGFNNRFLSDAIRAVPDEKVKIELSTGLSPCVFTPVEGDKFLFMVLPVRLK